MIVKVYVQNVKLQNMVLNVIKNVMQTVKEDYVMTKMVNVMNVTQEDLEITVKNVMKNVKVMFVIVKPGAVYLLIVMLVNLEMFVIKIVCLKTALTMSAIKNLVCV